MLLLLRLEMARGIEPCCLRAADPFRKGGGRPFSRADRAHFLEALDRALRQN